MMHLSDRLVTLTPTPPYRGLIFDCDGTLANSLPVHFQAWATALQAVGVEFSEPWYYQHCGFSAIPMIELLNQQFRYQLDPALVQAAYRQHYRSLLHQVQAIQPVADIVRAHAGHVPLALASNGDRSIVTATLDTLQLGHLFETIVTLEDVAQGKPAPDMFLLAARRLGVNPEDCIVYEDSTNGLEAARRAGMRSILVKTHQI
jgi:HAD superfamily hydrolase (TIGR01509 family)